MWSKDVGTTGSIPVDIAKMRGILKAKQGILLRINHSITNIEVSVSKGDERCS